MRICGITVVTGSYGKVYSTEEKPVVKKRMRPGRPRKNEISEGHTFVFSKSLDKLMMKWATSQLG